MQKPFWREKSLSEMTEEEWESLCDHCGKCCLHKLEDEDTGEILYTRVACKLLDLESCRCTHYDERSHWVPDCLNLRHGFAHFSWLPSTCAYRLLAKGADLPVWHPLVSGDEKSVHKAGISIRGLAIPESEADDVTEEVIEWLD